MTGSGPGRAGHQLADQVAIVTGAAGGIGEVYCRALAEAGASVVVADLDEEGARKVASALAADGLRALPVEVDVASEESVNSMVHAAVSAFGGVDILVNNAAMFSEVPKYGLTEIPIELYEKVHRVNVIGPLLGVRAVIPQMKARGAGKIINQASAAAFLPGTVYRLSKHAVVGLTASLAVELGPHNINVNAIAPGLIATEAGFRSTGPLGSQTREARYTSVPHSRPDRPPSALVGALLLLASAAGDFINGQTINVDGGYVIRL
jgi:NAD(P)-dependent dehydrogenase (short-subunit alcohol dehydrogenase family)